MISFQLATSAQVVGGNGEELYSAPKLAVRNISGTLTLETGPWYVKIEAEQGSLEYTIMMTEGL